MKRKSTKKAARKSVWDPQKDSIFKELAAQMSARGFEVRREELKQGHGWKVVSGTCRVEERKVIFVDRKLPQDEQIAFLVDGISSLGLVLTAEELAKLPEKIREQLQVAATTIAA